MRLGFFCLLTMLLFSPSAATCSEWFGNNESQLDRLIKSPGQKKPVAIFDWDNTVIKNDIGDATFFWMVAHDRIRRPKSWRETSRYLTGAAIRELDRYCAPLPISADCADSLLTIYNDGLLKDGKTGAWKKGYDPDLMKPAYAWVAQLLAGYRPDEVREMAEQVIRFNLKNKVGARQRIGSKEYPSFIRIYNPMKRLIAKLKRAGFDVWVVSASSQYIVEPFAKRVGISADHVIGIRPVLDSDGKITADFEGCGTKSSGQSVITYRKGKRCWINKVIFNMKDKRDQMERPSPIAFGAGDSDTDLFFLRDATALRLVINRNKRELMCHAYANQDGNWIINPMFILPKPKKADGYTCGDFGLPDQEDSVY